MARESHGMEEYESSNVFRIEEMQVESAPLQLIWENRSNWVGRPSISSRDA